MAGCPMHHGMAKASGCTHVAVSTFSKLFPRATGVAVSEQEAAVIGGPGGLMHDFDGASKDSTIPAGYIFFAQFVDHDVTLDSVSDLRGSPLPASEINELPNIRSVSLDLDCVYGFGPEASPHIFDGARPGRLAVNSNGYDLARSPSGTALIGDPRNDENLFVSQLQLLFHRFHNKIYNERVYHREQSRPFNRFEEAQLQCRYHYQWLVLFDFLKRLCDPDVYRFAAKKIIDTSDKTFPYFYKPNEQGKLTMPVEFSVAAYRVGHVMVRSEYAVNADNTDVELFDDRFATLGFSPVPEDLIVGWRYLLPVDERIQPRMSKGIDPLLADELQTLPVVPSKRPNDKALAFRNILRGNVMSLPSGQAIARELHGRGYPGVDPDFDLRLNDPDRPAGNLTTVNAWRELDRLADGRSPLRDNTPLFYYILRESQVKHDSQRLGPVGSAILMEVFGGMLKYCGTSFVHHDWVPDPNVAKETHIDHNKLIEGTNYYPFDLADVVRFLQ